MTTSLRFAAGEWKAGIILFLCFLVPVTPLFAQVAEERSSPPLATPPSPPPALRPGQDRFLFDLLAAGISRLEADGKTIAGPTPLLQLLSGTRPFSRLLTEMMVADVCADGHQAGQEETSAPLWFFLGAIVYGVPLAYLLSPSPDVQQLPQVSRDDIARYITCYQDGVKSVHVKWAWIGLASMFAVAAVLALLLAPLAGRSL